MNLKDIIAKLPEAERAEAEKVIQDAITAANPVAGIDSKDKAAAFIAGNKDFKAALDSEISVRVAAHDERFMADKFPKLLDAKIKELTGPETDPIKLELAQIKAEREAEKAEAKREKLKAVALKVAATEGIPVDYVERFIDEDDLKTTDTVKAFASSMKAYAKAFHESEMKGKYGNVGAPQGGNAKPPAGKLAEMQAAYAGLMGQKRFQEALKLQAEIQELGATNGQ